MNCRTAGTTAIPSIQRQSGIKISTRITEISYPIVIIATLNVISFPRISVGAISDKYNGTIYAATPTPIPTKMRPTIKIQMYGARAIVTDPSANIISANKITFLRPILSDTYPEKRDPIAAPTRAKETIVAIYTVEIKGQVSSKYS